MKLLEVKNISKRFYSNQALKGVDFDVEVGEVHALAGENGAGKSTLMNILLGSLKPDEGEMFFNGEVYAPANEQEALSAGISMIHQELELVQHMSVAENIWIGRSEKFYKHGFYSVRECEKAAKAILDDMKVDIRPNAIIKTLSVAQMQMVELARALSYNSKLVIMDEPTSSLSDKEISVLYRIVRELSAKGTSVIFISHKLEEVFEIADRVTVFRDGTKIDTKKVSDTNMDELIAKIAGRKMDNLYPKAEKEIGEEVFRVENLCKEGLFSDISFSVRKGEILGFAGLVGSGRTEIMNGIFGSDKIDSGKIYLNGEEIKNRTPYHAISNGISMINEDRRGRGIVKKLSVKTNMTLSYFASICNKLGFIDKKTENKDAQNMLGKLHIKTANLDMPIWSLSGGNQQKVMIGRALLTEPKLLILDEPTRGVDVGAKYEIYNQCIELAKEGHGLMLISSELGEVMGMSDRILVIRNGKIVGEHEKGKADEQTIISEMFGIETEKTI